MIKGFQEFIMRGNVVDLAVGVIIGAAFGKVADGFMKSIVEPLIKLILGSSDPAKTFESVAIGPFPIGILISAVINFLLVAAVVYVFIVTPINRFREMQAARAAPPPPAAIPDDVKLLAEIRDLLAKQNK